MYGAGLRISEALSIKKNQCPLGSKESEMSVKLLNFLNKLTGMKKEEP